MSQSRDELEREAREMCADGKDVPEGYVQALLDAVRAALEEAVERARTFQDWHANEVDCSTPTGRQAAARVVGVLVAELDALRADLAAAEKQRDALLEAAKGWLACPLSESAKGALFGAIAAAERKAP